VAESSMQKSAENLHDLRQKLTESCGLGRLRSGFTTLSERPKFSSKQAEGHKVCFPFVVNAFLNCQKGLVTLSLREATGKSWELLEAGQIRRTGCDPQIAPRPAPRLAGAGRDRSEKPRPPRGHGG
jgi:hypothetical protein